MNYMIVKLLQRQYAAKWRAAVAQKQHHFQHADKKVHMSGPNDALEIRIVFGALALGLCGIGMGAYKLATNTGKISPV